MNELIAADLLKLRRRRGMWWTSLLLAPLIVAMLVILSLTGVAEVDGGGVFVTDLGSVMSVLAPVLAVLVAARMGSEERATGTLRYQLLTGTPRHRLYASKLAAFVLVCALLTAVGIAAITLAGLVLPRNGAIVVGAEEVLTASWNTLLPALAYGSVAFGVGALVGSTGPAITIALLLNLVGVNLLFLLTAIDEWFRHLVLSLGVDRLTTDDAEGTDRVSFVAAIVMVLGWSGAFLGAGWLRLRRIET